MCKCHLAPRPRDAPGARSSGSWGISPQSPTSARPATYRRSINFALAACVTNLSCSDSCGQTQQAAEGATIVRQTRGHTHAPSAHNTNRPLTSDIAGETWKRLSTLAAKAAKRARCAAAHSPTTERWRRTRGCVRRATLGHYKSSVVYASSPWRNPTFPTRNGGGLTGRENRATGS